jgi:hypothetical protein
VGPGEFLKPPSCNGCMELSVDGSWAKEIWDENTGLLSSPRGGGPVLVDGCVSACGPWLVVGLVVSGFTIIHQIPIRIILGEKG